MGVKIRLRRTGARNDVCYRVVAADTRSPRDGRFIEILGWYDPKLTGRNFNLKRDRIAHWMDEGAMLSDTVKSLLRRDRNEPANEPVVAEPVAEEPAAAAPAVEEPEAVAVPSAAEAEAKAEADAPAPDAAPTGEKQDA